MGAREAWAKHIHLTQRLATAKAILIAAERDVDDLTEAVEDAWVAAKVADLASPVVACEEIA